MMKKYPKKSNLHKKTLFFIKKAYYAVFILCKAQKVIGLSYILWDNNDINKHRVKTKSPTYFLQPLSEMVIRYERYSCKSNF